MSSRIPLIAGNWKMHKSCGEAVVTARRLLDTVSQIRGVEIFIAPAFTALSVVADVLKDSNVSMCAQDLFWKENGAFTGEISADMLKSVGCRYVIIGHSERRQFFFETNDTVNRKISAALKAGICPVLCVGETDLNRRQGETFSVIEKQIRAGLDSISSSDVIQVVLAYEPVWAIGTGKTATDYQAQEVHLFVRSCLEEIYSSDVAESIRVIYGGSVNVENIRKLMVMPDIDGALVGGASLESDVFSSLIDLVANMD